jgi:cysteine synthase
VKRRRALVKTLGGDAVVVTVFADDNKKYLTTDLLRQEPVKPGYLSPELELTGICVLPRHCRVCDGLPRWNSAN